MPNKQHPKPEDEPGAEERFALGVRNALSTPPQPKAPAKPKPKKV